MKKIKTRAFGKDVYLLGVDSNGIKYWVEEATWDCNWYWGIGYIETYTNNNCPCASKDIQSHSHFDTMFKTFDSFYNFFANTPFSKDEMYKIYEIMTSLYIARKYSDMLHCSGSHITVNPCADIIKNEEEYNRINKVLIPKLLDSLYKIMSD